MREEDIDVIRINPCIFEGLKRERDTIAAQLCSP
jgi:hypothetical protein